MILNVNKPKDYTSRDVLNVMSKYLKCKKIGHTGTLDPIATGVLIVVTEEDTKFVDMLTSTDKEYIATVRMGIKTDTLDVTGKVIEEKPVNVTKEQLVQVLNSFLGKTTQVVPAYSAVKVDGKKLYEYARAGEEVELPTREIDVKEIELIDFKDNLFIFRSIVSKGTYIRSLISDICEKLNTVGVMQELMRTKQGEYRIEDSATLNDIEVGRYKPISLDTIIGKYPKEKVGGEKLKAIRNGALVVKEFKDDYIVYVDEFDRIVAIYQTYDKDPSMAKPYIMYSIF